MSDNDFEQKLTQLYQQHKQQNKLSSDSKKALYHKPNWLKRYYSSTLFQTAQFSLAAVAIFGFFVLMWQQNNIAQQPNEQLAVKIDMIEVHYLEQQQYQKQLKYASNQALDQLEQAQQTLKHRKLIAGKLVNKADDWYIASCHEQLLVQIHTSVLSQLKQDHALDLNIEQGDLLAFKQNDKGEIIALLKGDSGLSCQNS